MNHLKALRLWAVNPSDKLSSGLRCEYRGRRRQGRCRCLDRLDCYWDGWTSSGKTPTSVKKNTDW